MNARTAAFLVVGVAACGLGGYGVGSGWVRIGPPARELSAALPAAPMIAAIVPPPAPAPLDHQLVRTQLSSGTPGVLQIREADPEAPAGAANPPEYVTDDFSKPVTLRSSGFSVVLEAAPAGVTVTVGTVAATVDPKVPTRFNFKPGTILATGQVAVQINNNPAVSAFCNITPDWRVSRPITTEALGWVLSTFPAAWPSFKNSSGINGHSPTTPRIPSVPNSLVMYVSRSSVYFLKGRKLQCTAGTAKTPIAGAVLPDGRNLSRKVCRGIW